MNKSIQRLFNYGLVDSLRFFGSESGKASNTRLITLTPSGYHLVRSWGLPTGYFDALGIATRGVAQHKRNVSTAQVVVSWLKNTPSCTSFALRQTVKDYVTQSADAIVRPSAIINVETAGGEESIFVETVRRTEGNAEELLKKLARYNAVISYMENKPELLIVGEDEAHTRELYDYLVANGADMGRVTAFTHDLAIAGDFRSAFYTFSKDQRIQLYIA